MGPNNQAYKSLKSQIIAHRGFWFDEPGFARLEPNSFEAIMRASDLGFGLETDIRDHGTEIAIEHDAFADSKVLLKDISHLPFMGPVCLNIKADGLGQKIKDLNQWENSFFFDLSVPESIKYLNLGLPVADRVSEYEALKDNLQIWIWVDAFHSDWWADGKIIRNLLSFGHQVVLVSPELHGRKYVDSWHCLKPIIRDYKTLYLCTDLPITAFEFMSQ